MHLVIMVKITTHQPLSNLVNVQLLTMNGKFSFFFPPTIDFLLTDHPNDAFGMFVNNSII